MKTSLQRLIPLAALLAFALFPVGWLTTIWPPATRIGRILFPSEAAHSAGHSLLFATIGAALLAFFPGLLRRPVAYLALILSVAISQEAFQLLYKRRGVVVNDLTDIAIDLVAAGVVFLIWYSWAQVRSPNRG